MILPHHEQWPKIHETAFIAPSADIVGEVKIGAQSSIWFQCVVRGDVNTIELGDRTNIQDQSCLHVTRREAPLVVGNDVTVGHRVILHGCTVKDRVLVGMGAIVMDHAVIGEDSIIGAGSIVTKSKEFPPRSLIFGSPAKRVRELTDEEVASIKQSSVNYVQDASQYASFLRGPKKFGSDDLDLEVLEMIDEPIDRDDY